MSSLLTKTFFNSRNLFRPLISQSKNSYVSHKSISRKFSSNQILLKRAEVSVTFVHGDGSKTLAKGKEGDNLLDIIVDQEVDIDGFGACEGTLACSTCHLIFKKEDFDKLPDEATDEELDMLDLAYGLTDTSRLGCQVCMTKEIDGIEVQVPEGINDQR